MNKDRALRGEDDLYELFRESEKPASAWKIGAEVEKIGVDRQTGEALRYGDPGLRNVPTILHTLIERHGWVSEPEVPGGPLLALRRGQASVTLEPGGQLELSGAPLGDIHAIATEARGHLDELRSISDELGLAWLGLGFHPTARQADLDWVPKSRYGIMQIYLPSRGAYGLDMMRRTATVQANYDYLDERDALRKLRVSMRLAPVTTAMFANSPFVEGHRWGGRSYRAQVWLDVDNSRAGLVPAVWHDGARYEDYVNWALDAPMFLIKRDKEVVENTGQTFRSFLRHGFRGHRATTTDWETHVNSVFPEVRLKRTLEIRGADCQGPATLHALPALWTGIFYDERALAEAEALSADFSHDEVAGVRKFVPGQALHAPFRGATLLPVAQRLLEIAEGGLERRARRNHSGHDERIYLAGLRSLLEHGQCPADVLLTGLPEGPLSLARLIERAELR